MTGTNCEVTAEATPTGAMDVVIKLKGLRARHIGSGKFEIFSYVGNVPFAIKHQRKTMRPRMILKITSKLQMNKLRRALWGAQRRQSQFRKVLVDDSGQNPHTVDHAD